MFAYSSENLLLERNVWKDKARGYQSVLVCVRMFVCERRGVVCVNVSLCVHSSVVDSRIPWTEKKQTEWTREQTGCFEGKLFTSAKTYWASQIIQRRGICLQCFWQTVSSLLKESVLVTTASILKPPLDKAVLFNPVSAHRICRVFGRWPQQKPWLTHRHTQGSSSFY